MGKDTKTMNPEEEPQTADKLKGSRSLRKCAARDEFAARVRFDNEIKQSEIDAYPRDKDKDKDRNKKHKKKDKKKKKHKHDNQSSKYAEDRKVSISPWHNLKVPKRDNFIAILVFINLHRPQFSSFLHLLAPTPSQRKKDTHPAKVFYLSYVTQKVFKEHFIYYPQPMQLATPKPLPPCQLMQRPLPAFYPAEDQVRNIIRQKLKTQFMAIKFSNINWLTRLTFVFGCGNEYIDSPPPGTYTGAAYTGGEPDMRLDFPRDVKIGSLRFGIHWWNKESNEFALAKLSIYAQANHSNACIGEAKGTFEECETEEIVPIKKNEELVGAWVETNGGEFCMRIKLMIADLESMQKVSSKKDEGEFKVQKMHKNKD